MPPSPAAQPMPERQPIPGVKNLVAVASGKGGVGKTTVAVNLALALEKLGHKVGLLDADVYGPNVPIMLGTTKEPQGTADRHIIPVESQGLKVISMGLLNPGDKPMIWRGPMLHSVITQFLRSVEWGELDYLIIDLPPGTGDVQLTLIQTVAVTGAVVVTTPSIVALADVRKAIEMFRQVNVEVLGVVENMSAFTCPHCGKPVDIFGHGEGAKTAMAYGVPVLGEMYPRRRGCADRFRFRKDGDGVWRASARRNRNRSAHPRRRGYRQAGCRAWRGRRRCKKPLSGRARRCETPGRSCRDLKRPLFPNRLTPLCRAGERSETGRENL